MHDPYPATKRRFSFFSTAIVGITMTICAVVGSTTVLGLYALRIVDRKADNVFDLARITTEGLPELLESLPPIFSDITHDQRSPDYIGNIDATVRLVEFRERGETRMRPIVEITNNGDKLVSLLSMRVVVTDDQGNPVGDQNEWAATPIAFDDNDWKGPLMPGSKRILRSTRYRLSGSERVEDYTANIEITDIRVWSEETKTKNTELTGSDSITMRYDAANEEGSDL
jgi:hypothetical protein